MSKIISVVVPCYQVEDYLGQCVKTLLDQTFSNYEIILVDDGSRDNTPQICDEFAKNNSCIKVVHKENGGLSDARNVGMKYAEGEYICFIDSDDYIHPEYLSSMYQAIIQTDSDVAVCAYETVSETNAGFPQSGSGEYTVMSGADAVRELILSDKLMNYAWNKLYKKELFDNVKYPVGKRWEDIGVTYKVFDTSKRVVYIDKSLYYYLQRPGSITSSSRIENCLDQYELLLIRYNDLKDDYPEICDALKTQLCACSYNCWSFMQNYKKPLSDEEKQKVRECIEYLNKNGKQMLTRWTGNDEYKSKVKLYFKCPLVLKLIIKAKRLIDMWR